MGDGSATHALVHGGPSTRGRSTGPLLGSLAQAAHAESPADPHAHRPVARVPGRREASFIP